MTILIFEIWELEYLTGQQRQLLQHVDRTMRVDLAMNIKYLKQRRPEVT